MFKVGEILSGQLAYNRSDPTRVAQGELRLGGAAPAPQRDGMWLAGQLDYFDWDRWLAVHGRADGPRSRARGPGWTCARTGWWRFRVTGPTCRLKGAIGIGAWQVGIAGREATGTHDVELGGAGRPGGALLATVRAGGRGRFCSLPGIPIPIATCPRWM